MPERGFPRGIRRCTSGPVCPRGPGWASKTLRIKISVGRPAWGGKPLQSLFQPDAGRERTAGDGSARGSRCHRFYFRKHGSSQGCWCARIGCSTPSTSCSEMDMGSSRGRRPGDLPIVCAFRSGTWYDHGVFRKWTFPGRVRVHAPDIVEAIQTHRVTHVFGSPALLTRVVDYYGDSPPRLDSVREGSDGGAPVSRKVLQGFGEFLAGGEIFTPYGATEALPVSSIASSELLALRDREVRRGSVSAGRSREWTLTSFGSRRTIRSAHRGSPRAGWRDGRAGSRRFQRLTGVLWPASANRLSKLRLRNGCTGHRTGDLGYLDDRGRIWFCWKKKPPGDHPAGSSFFSSQPKDSSTSSAGTQNSSGWSRSSPSQTPVLCVELGRREALD